MHRYLLIRKINKALNVHLSKAQIDYIFKGYNRFIPGERKQGKTTAHIIRLCLRKEPIFKDYLKKGVHSDMSGGFQYDRWFTKEFLRIRNILKENGIKVCEII